MLGAVVQDVDPVFTQGFCQLLPHRHHVHIIVGAAPGIPRVVEDIVIPLKGFGGVGVHDQHLGLAVAAQPQGRGVLEDFFDVVKIQLGVVAQVSRFETIVARRVVAGQILLDHVAPVLGRDLGRGFLTLGLLVPLVCLPLLAGPRARGLPALFRDGGGLLLRLGLRGGDRVWVGLGRVNLLVAVKNFRVEALLEQIQALGRHIRKRGKKRQALPY